MAGERHGHGMLYVNRPLLYSSPIENEETLHKRIFDACQTIHNRRRACERLQQSVIRCVYACGDLGKEHSERLLRILI